MQIKQFLKRLLQATGIWFFTNLLASLMYVIAPFAGIRFYPFLCDDCFHTLQDILVFGAVFSFPVVILLIINLYLLERFKSPRSKLTYSITSVLFLCSLIVGSFIIIFGTDFYSLLTIIAFLTPYFFSAQLNFLLIGNYQTVKTLFSKKFLKTQHV